MEAKLITVLIQVHLLAYIEIESYYTTYVLYL